MPLGGSRLESVSFELESIVICFGEVNHKLGLPVSKERTHIFVEILLKECLIDSGEERSLIGQSFKSVNLC